MRSNNQPTTIENRSDNSRQPEEVTRLIGDRLRVTDISARFVLAATSGAVSRSEVPVLPKQAPVEPKPASSIYSFDQAKVTSNNSGNQDPASFQIPTSETTDQSIDNRPAVSGEVVDMSMENMAKQARLGVDEAWGGLEDAT